MASVYGYEDVLVPRVFEVVKAIRPELIEHAVCGAADWGEVEKEKLLLSVLVVFDGMKIKSRSGKNKVLTQRWLTVVSLRNASADRGKTVRSKAGPILQAIIDGVDQWRTQEPGYGMAEMIDPPAPDYEKGRAWFPLAFQVDVYL